MQMKKQRKKNKFKITSRVESGKKYLVELRNEGTGNNECSVILYYLNKLVHCKQNTRHFSYLLSFNSIITITFHHASTVFLIFHGILMGLKHLNPNL